jgi:ribose transport system ATP-binding protein
MTATAQTVPASANRPPTLEMRGISKTFPGTKALNNVQLKAWGGEIQSLMGENGAGKSTLMKVLSGAYKADAGGEILIDGNVIDITNPHVAREHGISIIYQELSLLPNLSVAENIFFGRESHRHGLIDRRGMADDCREVLQRLGATFGPETIVFERLDPCWSEVDRVIGAFPRKRKAVFADGLSLGRKQQKRRAQHHHCTAATTSAPVWSGR